LNKRKENKMKKRLTGKKIRRIREKLGLTREEFAKKVKMSPNYLVHVELDNMKVGEETAKKIKKKFKDAA